MVRNHKLFIIFKLYAFFFVYVACVHYFKIIFYLKETTTKTVFFWLSPVFWIQKQKETNEIWIEKGPTRVIWNEPYLYDQMYLKIDLMMHQMQSFMCVRWFPSYVFVVFLSILNWNWLYQLVCNQRNNIVDTKNKRKLYGAAELNHLELCVFFF